HGEPLGLAGDGAVKAHHEVFLSMADEPADPEDFSSIELEIDIDRCRSAKTFHLEDESPSRLRGVRRKQIPWVAPHHQADKAGRIEPGERAIGGDGSILENGYVIAEVKDLVQSV